MARAVLLVLLALIPATAAGSPILINASFEQGPSFSHQDLDIATGSTEIVGWVVTGSSVSGGAIDYLGAPWDVSDGIRAIDLDGRDSVFGGIEQTFTTIPGQLYNVRFDLSGNPHGGPVVKQARVSVGGFSADYAFDSTGQSMEALLWETIAFSFWSTTSAATLSFKSLSPTPNSYGALIDNVSVTAVPEPSAAVLLAIGLGVLGARHARRRGQSDARVAYPVTGGGRTCDVSDDPFYSPNYRPPPRQPQA